MTQTDFLNLIAELVEREPGTIHPTDLLQDLEWTSLAVVAFIALVDERFNIVVDARQLAKCTTVHDLEALVGDKVSA